jgi:trehalose 6-phosphate synthase/phosphatase
MESVWVGWPGDVSRFDATQRAKIEKHLAEIRAIPLHLTQAEITRYYEGFSNGVLWPLFHYLTDKVQREAWRDWKTYREVNRRFADMVAAQYRPGDLVWVHDYQLALVPSLLRGLIPDARIGFFLHIPFPSSEVFRILPWREEMLRGMLGADLIGFHTHSYLRHFSRAVLHVLGLESDGDVYQEAGRSIHLGVFPMGIDAEHFSRVAESPSVLADVEAIKKRDRNRKLILGIDRLDYTKGLARRMLSLEVLFERRPALRNKIRFVQVVVPSRTKVESYVALRRQLDEMVGRINGAYGSVNTVPIHYLYRSIPEQELISLYRAADVMLVTPLRDGMNLVAKEFVASRPDEDGVLILSEFAGAAAEMIEAIHVNPYDLDRVASAIESAVAMPEEERRTRMSALRSRVQTYDSYRWANDFIGALKSTQREETAYSHGLSTVEEIERLLERLRDADRLVLLLDYDGTLVPFASKPELAAPNAELKELLRKLAERPGTSVHIISGRTFSTLERWFGDLPIGLHAEHGFWSRSHPRAYWRPMFEAPPDWKKPFLPILKDFAERTPGALLEEKTAGCAWHYRMSDPEFGALQARGLRLRLEEEMRELPVEVLRGAKVLEVRLKGINKGNIATGLFSERGERPTVLAIGDDQTDEDLFAALPTGSFTVHVGPRPSRAQYRIEDALATRSFLSRLLGSGSESSASTQSAAMSV